MPLDVAFREGVEAQSEVALKNMKSVLEASGSSMSQVIKCTVFLKDVGSFGSLPWCFPNR